ncbi:MAG: hypothetical protein DRN04_14125 [Thermoprotei archaeon]|nr:MAG: hypothetical protein DRN04_14125 [Thermoprotei archaeon]
MVHIERALSSSRLEEFLGDVDGTIDEAKLWVSAGSRDNWVWSIRYAFEVELGYVYWGSRLRAEDIRSVVELFRGRGGVYVSSRRLVENYLLNFIEGFNGSPNIILFYVSDVGFIGAGLVTEIEFDFYHLFWPDEKRERPRYPVYPFRYKMKVLWLHESVVADYRDAGKWVGDGELGELLKTYTMSGLQAVSRPEVVGPVKELLKKRIKEFLPKANEVFKKPSVCKLEGPRPFRWSFELFAEEVERRGLVVDKAVLRSIVSALSSGKHVILVGPPGVGKTSLVEALAESHGLVLVKRTATAEWTRVDLIGGPVFVGGEVRWRSGALLEAIARHFEAKERGRNGALLLIDELNRANLDKAFGEFFTIFGSSDPEYWKIPDSIIYEIKEYKGKVDRWAEIVLKEWERKGGELSVPSDFRVIGTMNTYDRRYLFTLGYALLRRFAVIEVSNPDVEGIRQVLMQKAKAREEVVNKIIEFYNGVKDEVDLGVALLIDMAKIADNVYEEDRDLGKAIACAVVSIAIPQFEGLPHDKLERIGDFLKRFSSEAYDVFKRYYPELGGRPEE